MPAKHEFRERLIRARTTLGLTRREMAEELLTPYSTYEQWELGRFRTPGTAAIAAEMMVRKKDLNVGDGATTVDTADGAAETMVSDDIIEATAIVAALAAVRALKKLARAPAQTPTKKFEG
jgi:transcriptional regulator with XRE-family HTH domain